jgi:hypothetical protein
MPRSNQIRDEEKDFVRKYIHEREPERREKQLVEYICMYEERDKSHMLGSCKWQNRRQFKAGFYI